MYASWVAAAIVALSAAGCSQSEPSAGASSDLDRGSQVAISQDSPAGDTPHDEKSPAVAADGHQRMLMILKEINAFMKQQSPMLGDGRLSA